MDEFKPEDDMKADRSDRRTGRSRQSSERDADPQINFDDVDLDADEGRPTRAGKAVVSVKRKSSKKNWMRKTRRCSKSSL
jgi:hypothetical protein